MDSDRIFELGQILSSQFVSHQVPFLSTEWSHIQKNATL